MKRKALNLKRSNRRGKSKTKMKDSLARHLTVQLGQVALIPLQRQQCSTRFQKDQNLVDCEAQTDVSSKALLDFEVAAPDVNNTDEKDFILSQDFFCTPDYITPDAPPIQICFDSNNEEYIPCPKSPEKLKTVRSKRQKLGDDWLDGPQPVAEIEKDTFGTDDAKKGKTYDSQKFHSYVSQSAVALRCRVMPPPCIKNPYLRDASVSDLDPFDNQRSKCAGLYGAVIGSDGLSRYRTDFHEIGKIGDGNFSRVFKVLKRIDGCFYAVKHSMRQLHKETERQKALMEVQALAALGSHENIVGYHSSWFENEQLYIQMELCDHSLSINKFSKLFSEARVLRAMHQIAKALQFIHERGIAHLDVKPDNIYVKDGTYKLGDFGCATLIDRSLPIEEGDARYMPQEILNENFNHLDKVDIFSLGVTIYELVRGSALPESGPQFLNLKEGKLPLLHGHPLQFQNLLKAMMDSDPVRRPSAKELVENPIFDRLQKAAKPT